MGIRFECPQGHQLHVKAYLAGERGICPECDARFTVPAESGGRVSALEEPAVAEVAAPPTDAMKPIDLAAPKPRRTRRRRRRDRARKITVALSALVLLLLLVLALVLNR